MKVIKFEVSFKSDGSVAGPVARRAEGGWTLRDAERQPAESFVVAAVRSLLGTAGARAGRLLRACRAPAAAPQRAGWLDAVCRREPPSCGGQPHGWGLGVTIVLRVQGQAKLRLPRPQGLMAVWRRGSGDGGLGPKGLEKTSGPGPHLSSPCWPLSPCRGHGAVQALSKP